MSTSSDMRLRPATSNVATVLSELAEKVDSKPSRGRRRRRAVACPAPRLSPRPRGGARVTEPLASWLAAQHPRPVASPWPQSERRYARRSMADRRQRGHRDRRMIWRAHITAWRVTAPWTTDARSSRTSSCHARSSTCSRYPSRRRRRLSRRAALNELLLKQAARYSEDIDLVQPARGPIGEVMTAIRERLESVARHPQTPAAGVLRPLESTASRRRCADHAAATEDRDRTPASRRARAAQRFAVENPWFTASAEVVTFAPGAARYEAARDVSTEEGAELFDLATCLQHVPRLDPAKIIECFHHYLAAGGHRISRAEYEANMATKLDDPAFTDDILPLLVATDSPPRIEAVERGPFG